MIFYIILSLIATFAIYTSKKKRFQTEGSNIWKDKSLAIWFVLWVFFATFRLVDFPIGGTDAPNYIKYFEICRDNYMPEYFYHFADDILFKYYNQLLNIIWADYHFYFIVTYSIIVYSIIFFCKEFCPKFTNYTPYLLTFFLYLRSYSTIRYNLSIVILIFACILLVNKKFREACIVAFLSFFVHKAGLLYALFIPFYLLFYKRGLSLKMTWILIVSSVTFSTVAQFYFIQFTADMDLSGSYTSYASKVMGSSFLENAWKIAFEQLFLGFFIFLYHVPLKRYINHLNEREKERINLIYLLCIFDLLLIPINYTLNIWRGYEYFYLARIVMWGVLLHITTLKVRKEFRSLLSFFFLACFIAWIVFRVYNTWESSGLMPYVFEPFMHL